MKLDITENQPLLDALQRLFPDSSKNHLRSLVAQERVWLNGKKVVKPALSLSPGDLLEVKRKFQFEEHSVKIVFEDNHLVVVEKPHGLLSVADDEGVETNLHTILKRRHPQRRVWPIHRLDKETSGLILFAYTESARDALKEQMAKREISRQYIGVVEGRLADKKGTWTSHLLQDSHLYVIPHPEGKIAITHYEVLAETKKTSTLRFTLETGRKNQIRVQAKEAGHPIIGDKKYGAAQDFLGRMALHAEKLTFFHPVRQKMLSFVCAAEFFRAPPL